MAEEFLDVHIDVDEFIINRVQERPFLFDSTRKDHKDITQRENAFAAIGELLGMPGVQVAKKWKYLRDHFIRERKVIEKKQRNGCPIHGVDATPKWKYYKRLLFLLDHIRHRSRSTTTSNGVSGKEEEGSVECTQSEPFTEPEVTVSIASSPLEDSCVFERFDVDDDPGANIPNDGPSRTPSEQPPSKRLRKSDEQQAEMVNVIRSVGSALTNRLSSSSSSGMDTEAAFTYSVAQRLRNMSPQKNRLAQLKIQEVLYAVEYGD